MAISAYIGLQGSGKSYGVVEKVIIPALYDGRTVWTNIPFNTNALLEDGIPLPHAFDIQDIIDQPTWFDEVLPPGVLFVLDEVQTLWPSGLKLSNVHPAHISFLTEHRHRVGEDKRSTEIVFLTQRLSLIAAFARATVEKTLVSNNLAVVGTPNKYRLDIYPGAVIKDQPNTRKCIRQTYGSYKPEIYQYYKSHTQSEFGVGDETRADNRLNIFKGFKIWAWLGSVIVFVCLGVYFSYATFNSYFSKAEETAQDVNISADSPLKVVSKTESNPQALVKKMPPKDSFLSQFDEIFIDFNMGRYPDIDYSFQLVSGSNRVTVSQLELSRIGYKFKPVNNCIVQITGRAYHQFAFCKNTDESDRNIFPGSVFTNYSSH